LSHLPRNEGRSWSAFYKYVKRRIGSRANIPSIRDRKGRIVTDPKEKANEFNAYYATVFNTADNIQLIPDGNMVETFEVDSKVIRRRIQRIGKNKSVGPDGISGDILILSGRP
jgi:hypothetical protein